MLSPEHMINVAATWLEIADVVAEVDVDENGALVWVLSNLPQEVVAISSKLFELKAQVCPVLVDEFRTKMKGIPGVNTAVTFLKGFYINYHQIYNKLTLNKFLFKSSFFNSSCLDLFSRPSPLPRSDILAVIRMVYRIRLYF